MKPSPSSAPAFAGWLFACLLFLLAAQPAAGDAYAHLDPSVRVLIRQLEEKYRAGERYLPGYDLKDTDSAPGLPRIYAPTRPRDPYTKFKWKENIVTTIFWCGEKPTQNNPTPNNKSSWDTKWQESFGGYDDPNPASRAWDFRPKGFIPGQNTFYIALPYNDIASWNNPRADQKLIPWYRERYKHDGRTILKGQWIAIRYGSRICYAQWEDVGPFETTDFDYVFGDARPRTKGNKGAGLDVSPAVRDFLGLRSGGLADWRFVELDEVPAGPWRKYGTNNPFVNLRAAEEEKRRLAAAEQREELQAHMVRLREARDSILLERPLPR